MITKDDRTDEQKQDLCVLVVGTDSFMSGWGMAEGGASVAAWACTPDDAYRVERWVRNRGDMKRVRVVSAKGYRPRNARHFHIYAAGPGHPATA